MRVKLLAAVGVLSSGVTLTPGEEYDLEEKFARSLVASGQAEAVAGKTERKVHKPRASSKGKRKT